MYFATHLFSNISSGREAVGGSIEQLLYGTMTFAAISGAFDLDQTLLNLFNLEDLKHYSRKISQYIYMCQCNSIELGDDRMSSPRITALIEDIVGKADTVISNGGYVADLRFGHDSHLMAFCAKIGVKGIGERVETEDAVNWRGWLYTPFAANFYIVFYKNRTGNILAKCYINEREIKLIGLSGGPYYNWSNLKEYLITLCGTSDKKSNLNTDTFEDSDMFFPR